MENNEREEIYQEARKLALESGSPLLYDIATIRTFEPIARANVMARKQGKSSKVSRLISDTFAKITRQKQESEAELANVIALQREHQDLTTSRENAAKVLASAESKYDSIVQQLSNASVNVDGLYSGSRMPNGSQGAVVPAIIATYAETAALEPLKKDWPRVRKGLQSEIDRIDAAIEKLERKHPEMFAD